MITFSNVSLAFDDRPVLKSISLEILPGKTQVILGGSGSGKTTILRLILGLIQPDSGSIRIDGQEIVGLKERDMVPIRANMAMVFQGAALFDSLTVGENVGYRLWEAGQLTEEEIEKRVKESLQFVGLADTIDKMPAELSGGMKKRVAIARALACHPKIILYDEPTAGLDPINTRMVHGLITRCRKNGQVTQVVVTHDLETALRVGDRLMMLYEGEKIFDGTAEALRAAQDPRIKEFLNPSDNGEPALAAGSSDKDRLSTAQPTGQAR